jgi:DNA mismatch repair protein MutS
LGLPGYIWAMSSPTIPDGTTPAMAQWFALKARHQDALLFFRMGDFYEMFFDDAHAAVAALGIALTHRGTHAGAPIPMCGVPVHAANTYLERLIKHGYRIAIGEQMEDPKARIGKAPIRRDVVRLITPGTLTEDNLLEASRPNLLLALVGGKDGLGAAWLDVSTGLFETQALAASDLPALLGRLDPAEILAPEGLDLGEFAPRGRAERAASPPPAARKLLAEAFAVADIGAFGSFTDLEAVAASCALDYVRATQVGKLPHLSRPQPMGVGGTLAMDAATRQSLEISRTRDGGTQHTLLASVQRTLTAPGARMLAAFLGAPLTDVATIVARQNGWGWIAANDPAARDMRACLRGAPDMARALGRLSLGRGSPRDLAGLRDGMAAATRIGAILDGPKLLLDLAQACLVPPDLAQLLAAALADPAPLRVEDGAIAAGFDGELDAERGLRDDSRRVIAAMQMDFAQRFGVASLKIRHHAQLGYIVEVPSAAADRMREFPDLTLRQGMANGARFTHPDLSALDRRITEAADRAAARERVIFAQLVAATLQAVAPLAACAAALAQLDVLQSCALLAQSSTATGGWCRPVLGDDDAFLIEDGRHPVVEAALSGSAAFVPNDCDLSPDRRVLLLTGPNMAGKSTFLRQNALIVILAQAGLPVPARSARIGVVDRLFSRVGASDELARGRSTFMVEMTETAAILHQAGPHSLVVVDEIGRGTATSDGLAIAWAVLEALHNTVRCRTIFATHFHELAGLSNEMPRLAPHTMRVKEWKGDVVFLHEVAAGAGGRSWGVHVAKLAGVTAPVVRRAAALLAQLEDRATKLTDAGALPLFAQVSAKLAVAPPDPLRDALAAIDPDKLTPREALDALYKLRDLVSGHGALD